MEDYLVICVDDEREVLDAVMRDIDELSSHFTIEAAESAAEAREVIAEYAGKQKPLALILCDHLMPAIQGVDFLIELNQRPATMATRKILLTGQAGLESTINAVNQGGLDFYIAKPWDPEQLFQSVVGQLTTYIILHEPNLLAYAGVLDQQRIFKAIHEAG